MGLYRRGYDRQTVVTDVGPGAGPHQMTTTWWTSMPLLSGSRGKDGHEVKVLLTPLRYPRFQRAWVGQLINIVGDAPITSHMPCKRSRRLPGR
jgi:hypothetical protein